LDFARVLGRRKAKPCSPCSVFAAREARGEYLRAAPRGAALRAAALHLPPRAGRGALPRVGAIRRFGMALQIYAVVIEMVRALRPLVAQIAKKDQNLGEQMRRALTSVPLNLHEGAYSQGGNVRARFHNAVGSAAEVRACLDVAEALGYIEEIDPKL